MNRQNFHHGLSPCYEEERPQKAGAGAGKVVNGSEDGHIRPGIGGTKAYKIYGFFVRVLEVIYHAVRRCVKEHEKLYRFSLFDFCQAA